MVRRERGRPRKPNALSNAERQRLWRSRRAAERKAHPPRVIIGTQYPLRDWFVFQLWNRKKGDYVDAGLRTRDSLDEMRGKGWRMGYGKTLKDAIERFRKELAKTDPKRAEEERNWFKTHGGYKVVDSTDLSPEQGAKALSWLRGALAVPRIEYPITPEQAERARRIGAAKGLPSHIEGGKLIEMEGGPRLCLKCEVALEVWPKDLSVRCPSCGRIWVRTEVDRDGNVRIRNREIDRLRHQGIAPPPDYKWKRHRKYA